MAVVAAAVANAAGLRLERAGSGGSAGRAATAGRAALRPMGGGSSARVGCEAIRVSKAFD
ncbi:hypothetical protein SSP24_26110 [Streptomyces spinoverrucosus]|uniref:Uncharacterized protein n=1 Tax=Streptomyces spinoverrucosus TaxID=284043 RepID=A0A4Y3VIV9_9ACTN|nr:hypothetical protein SSP24_26110 [Streptomyces spinoverrucosus]